MSKSSSIITEQSNFLQTDWYKPLVEEVSQTIKMAVIDSRLRLVDGYWHAGKLIRVSAENEDITKLLHALAVDTEIAERSLWYAVKAYDTYPDTTLIPEGNNISWNKLITKYLTSPSEKIEIHKCNICGGDLAAACHTDGNGKP